MKTWTDLAVITRVRSSKYDVYYMYWRSCKLYVSIMYQNFFIYSGFDELVYALECFCILNFSVHEESIFFGGGGEGGF